MKNSVFSPLFSVLAAGALILPRPGTLAANDPTQEFRFDCGMSVATCFSGSSGQNGGFCQLLPSDLNGFVVGILDTSNPGSATPGLNWAPTMFHNAGGPVPDQWRADNLGEVFGIALDNQSPPNIYVTATSLYPGDFFGAGGPGGVYRLDGTTFGISTFISFADVGTVSLGNICFDPVNNQFFVSDLDHGLIRRVDAAGVEQLPPFDHGATGRAYAALPVINDSTGPDNLTDAGRRVFGLQVHQGRLYYAVWDNDGNEVWSVGLQAGGDFITTGAGGPRLEIDGNVLQSPINTPITDIAFSQDGKMLLGERNVCLNDQANLRTAAHNARALEFVFSSGNWSATVPYEIGAISSQNNSAGGVDYDCEDWIYASADAIQFGPQFVYGVQILPAGVTEVTNSYQIDLDGVINSLDKTFIGDVEVVRCCNTCITIAHEQVTCLTNGQYLYTFSVTNLFDGPVSWLGFLDLTNATVNGENNHLLLIDPPLQTGEGTTVSVMINSSNAAPDTLCFTLSAHDFTLEECCAIEHCVELPQCCAVISDDCVRLDPSGTGAYTYTFNYFNLSGVPVKYIYVTPDTNSLGCFTPVIVTLPTPLPNGAGTTVSVTLNVTGDCGPDLCLYISGHRADLVECCSEHRCITLPGCCQGKTYTLDADFELGTLVNLNHTPADQLQLNPVAQPFPFVNIACSTRGTVVRIDVNSGVVLGEYYTSPDGMGRNPSRTTVDKYGNVWVANRAEAGISGGQPKGSVVRIGLVLGGTRGKKDVSGNFVPDPAGAYLAPPYTYNTCVDRDGDGLIKTSSGLGDILPWSNFGSADTHGGVSTADDECITVYTRVNGSGTRFLAIDCDNNVWTGGLSDQDFQMLDGFTGLPVAGMDFNIGCGGYGGLIDGFGTLWSSRQIMRFVPSTSTPPGSGTCLPYYAYGLGINPLNCNVFASSGWDPTDPGNTGLLEIDPSGAIVNAYPAINSGGGLCVDGNGHVWVAQWNQIAHLEPVGPSHVLVGYIGGFNGAWGVAVDSNGKIWTAEISANRASRIDPTLAGGLGAVDMIVPLGAGAGPYNYSDMTGFVELAATCRSGFWSIIHDGCSPGQDWGTISWNATTPAGTGLTVEARAADNQGDLPAQPWTVVKNGLSFCGRKVQGQYLEVRVSFTGAQCSTESPVLFDLTIDCCPQDDPCAPANHPPNVVKCPDPITLCDAQGPTSVTVNATVTDADGDPLTVTWREGTNPPFDTDTVPAGGPPTSGTVGFTQTFGLGTHVVIMAIDDGHGAQDVCDIVIKIGDTTPPEIQCPPGISVVGFSGVVPDFQPVPVSDDCWPAQQIEITQILPPGTQVGVGQHTITIIATDGAGNSVTCQTFYAVSPKVVLAQPDKYAEFAAPATVTMEATLDPRAGEVQEMQFYEGNRLVGVSTRPPYQALLQDLPNGFYALRAVAVNPEGLSAVSPLRQISVGEPRPAPSPPMAVPVQEGDMLRLAVPTEPGVTCLVEYSDTVDPANWQVLKVIDGTGNTVLVTDDLNESPCRFYRIRVP